MACLVYDVFALPSLRVLFCDRASMLAIAKNVSRGSSQEIAWCEMRDRRLNQGVSSSLIPFLQKFIAPKRFRQSMKALADGCLAMINTKANTS